MFQVANSGYLLYATLTLPIAGLCLFKLYQEPFCGLSVGWRDGQWLIFNAGKMQAVQLQRGWLCLPLLLRLTLIEPSGGRAYSLVLFHDSAEDDALHRLRRRLILDR